VRIALVDPSRTVQRIVSGIMEPWGHEVRCFIDGPQALAFLQADPTVRALISSVELASYSGMQLVRDARILAGTQRPLYIVIMSSGAERSKMVEALENGADDFIAKPPAPEELRARLRAADRITSMQAQLVCHATTDSLTGLLNRRAFAEAAVKSLDWAHGGYPLSVFLCDLDKFKAINDSYGHDAGDQVLRKFSDEAKATDLTVGRLGGEEFAFLVQQPLDDAVEMAEHLREAVAGVSVKVSDKTINFICSIGVTEWEAGDTIDSLLRRADVALYEAKRSGRNRVVVADTFTLREEHDQWRGVARHHSRVAI
jgi:two-component system, cell cycle response regulator